MRILLKTRVTDSTSCFLILGKSLYLSIESACGRKFGLYRK